MSTLRAGAADSLELAPTRRRRGPSSYVLFKVGGWLVFSIAMMIGSLDVAPWHVILASESVYVLIGLVLALLLDRVYDRLGLGLASFGRTLTMSVMGACVAGMLWNAGFYYHRHRKHRRPRSRFARRPGIGRRRRVQPDLGLGLRQQPGAALRA